MNLVQQANFLEDVPKDQLVSMSQDPNAQFPAFLVLSEIQRRTTNEKNYQAMVNQPTTTVAEEVVSDFAQPTGLQGGAPQATPLPTNISAGLSGAPTAPMQMAASGGITGYANEGQTKLNYSNLRTKLTEDEIKIVNQAVMRDRTQRMQSDLGDKTGKFLGGGANVSEQIFSVLSGGGGNIPIFRGSPEEKKFIEVANIILENKNKKASGGLTGYATGDMTALPAGSAPMMGAGMGMDALGDNLEAAIEQYGVPALKTLGIINDDGSINYGTAALQALSINPAFRLGKAGLGVLGSGLSRFAPGTMSKLKGLPSKIKNRFTSPVSKVDESIITSGSMQTDRVFDAAKSGKTLLNTAQNVALPALVVKSMLPDGEETVTEEKIETPEEIEARIRKEEQEKYQEQLNQLKDLAGAKENKGDYRDLVRLGAGIMSAKNIGDIGTAVTGVLDAQDKRGLVGLQGKLTEAQTEQILANIEAMPKEALLSQMTNLIKASEAGLITDMEAAMVQYNALAKRYAELEGQETKPASEDANVIASYG